MATFEDVVIRVTERGAKETANAIGGVGKAAENTAGAVASLSRIMYTLLGAFSVKTLVDYTDKFQAMSNQIKLVTKSSEELTKTQERLFQLANQNRVGVEGLTELYTKLAMSQKQVGVSGENLWRVTDVVSKSIAVAGRSGQASANGLRQFIQGLVSGKVQGEELRSVLENTPYLAKTLADGLRVPVGALRELGAQGKLTSQTVVEALLRMQSQVDKDFAKTTVTISQALTILDNAFIRFIGQAGQTGSAASIVSGAIVLLAQNIDKVAYGLIAATAAWVGYAVAVRAVAAAQWLANAAIAANPVVRLVTIIGGSIALLIAFTTEWKTLVSVMTTVGTTAVQVFNWISEGVTGVIGWFTALNASINTSAAALSGAWVGAFDAITQYIGGWVTWLVELITVTIPGYWNQGIEMIKKFFVDGFTAIKDFVVNTFNSLKSYLDSFVKSALDFINKVIAAAQKAASAISSLGGGGGARQLDGARAEGGPVVSGKTYLVGENGPELFTPRGSGNIIPNGGSGSGQQLRAMNDNMSASRSQRALEDTFRAALRDDFASLRAIGNETNVRLDKLIELATNASSSASSGSSSSGLSSSSGPSGTTSGTSAINNFGIDGVNTGTVVQAPMGAMPTAGGTSYNDSMRPSVSSYADQLMNLNERYVNNNWLAGPDNRTTKFALQALKDFIANLPGDIKEQVIAEGRRRRGPVMAGYPIAFRSGGAFSVTGGTGVDSKVIPIRATPGERVDVRTRKQVRDETQEQASSGHTFIFNIETQDADSFRRSETQVLREFARRASAAMRK